MNDKAKIRRHRRCRVRSLSAAIPGTHGVYADRSLNLDEEETAGSSGMMNFPDQKV